MLDARDQQLSALREEVQRLGHEKAAALSACEKESSILREQWLGEVSRLEQERALATSRFQEEKAALSRYLADLEREKRAATTSPVVTTDEAAAAVGRAEQERAMWAAQCEAQALALRSSLEAAKEESSRLERNRE